MTTHICSQEAKIADLTNKQSNLMDLVKEINVNVKEIKAYIFEGGMETKYSTKEELKQAKEIQDLKILEMNSNVQQLKEVNARITRAVILGVLAFIGNALLEYMKN